MGYIKGVFQLVKDVFDSSKKIKIMRRGEKIIFYSEDKKREEKIIEAREEREERTRVPAETRLLIEDEESARRRREKEIERQIEEERRRIEASERELIRLREEERKIEELEKKFLRIKKESEEREAQRLREEEASKQAEAARKQAEAASKIQMDDDELRKLTDYFLYRVYKEDQEKQVSQGSASSQQNISEIKLDPTPMTERSTSQEKVVSEPIIVEANPTQPRTVNTSNSTRQLSAEEQVEEFLKRMENPKSSKDSKLKVLHL